MSLGSRYQDPLETWSNKFSRKFKENPWVPLGAFWSLSALKLNAFINISHIGCLATCGALVMSAVKMRAGKPKSMNYWLRARVVLQGVTLVALVAGSLALQRQDDAQISDLGIEAAELPRNEATTQLSSREKKRILEQQEFEKRLKGAEAATEQEQGIGMMIVKGPSVNKERREEEKKKVQTQQPDASQSPVLNEVKKSNKWGWWWSSGKSSEQQVKSNDSDST
jgi:hypothetical protein